MARSTQDVLEAHLHLRQEGNLDRDLEENYTEDAVLMTGYGIFRGREGVRVSAGILFQQLQGARYMYRTRLVCGEMGFLEWAAANDTMHVKDGADSYLIRDGRIHIQTIHYTLESL